MLPSFTYHFAFYISSSFSPTLKWPCFLMTLTYFLICFIYIDLCFWEQFKILLLQLILCSGIPSLRMLEQTNVVWKTIWNNSPWWNYAPDTLDSFVSFRILFQQLSNTPLCCNIPQLSYPFVCRDDTSCLRVLAIVNSAGSRHLNGEKEGTVCKDRGEVLQTESAAAKAPGQDRMGNIKQSKEAGVAEPE